MGCQARRSWARRALTMSAPKQKAGEGADDLAADFAALQSLSQSVLKEIEESGAEKELAEVVAEFEALVQVGSDTFAAQRLLKIKPTAMTPNTYLNYTRVQIPKFD